MLRRQAEMNCEVIAECHEGQGNLRCRSVLRGDDSELGIRFMHDDLIEPGASIGEHLHGESEEIYFVVEGTGTMIVDGREFPIGPGDVSLVRRGHTHGLVNSPGGPMRLLVVDFKPKGAS